MEKRSRKIENKVLYFYYIKHQNFNKKKDVPLKNSKIKTIDFLHFTLDFNFSIQSKLSSPI